MNLQEIIDTITADPTSDEALTAIRDMASQNERLTADNERLTNELTSTKTDLENSRKALNRQKVDPQFRSFLKQPKDWRNKEWLLLLTLRTLRL